MDSVIPAMAKQLDILALEPYHGGARRAMLEAISRCSRHRWTLLKLPARRFERRQLVAATWFAEVLSRNGVGRVDVVFSSEALNLADFLRLRPDLARRPSVVYFHDNQLPDVSVGQGDGPTDLVNLNSATAASEIWFNSLYNLRTFLGRASGLVARHPELQMRDPMRSLAAKAHLVPPPIDLGAMHDMASQAPAQRRDPRSLLLDARGADHAMVSEAFATLERRKERMELTVIGRVKGMPTSLRPITLDERDDQSHLRSLLKSSILVSARPNATHDDLTIRALGSGCHPIVPNTGLYPELLPEPLHAPCLHDGTAESLVSRVLDAWYLERPTGLEFLLDEILSQFDAIRACKIIDERLEMLAHVPTLRIATKSRKPVRMA
jgi:hypothetical protein